ncbi:MAG: alkaline shock response membrane anchor protein AmaP [Clostridiaceae bacterium]|nr:alkaline shock response membrane anchor protein AmaP [Clostridiaceae bacterium]
MHNTGVRVLVIILTLVTGTVAVFGLIYSFQPGMAEYVPLLFKNLAANRTAFWIVVPLLFALLLTSIFALGISVDVARLRRTRLRQNDLGAIDISVAAIETVALNATISAQAGVRDARASVWSAKSGKINVQLRVSLYPDVEIPSEMERIQERIRKDIERFTGIQVDNVIVKVTHMEQMGARIER